MVVGILLIFVLAGLAGWAVKRVWEGNTENDIPDDDLDADGEKIEWQTVDQNVFPL